MSSAQIRTGELARRACVNKESLRFYERKGLLKKAARTPSGYRVYREADVDRVLFIKNAQLLGFSLREVQELLVIADGDLIDCNEVRAIAERKLHFVNSQIESLKRLGAALDGLVRQCTLTGTIDDCPIIESISRGGKPNEA